MACRIAPSEYMMELKEKLINERGLAEVSANKYINDLCRLNQNSPFKTLGFLKSSRDDIMEKLSHFENNTKLTYLSAILACLEFETKTVLYGKTIKFYSDEYEKLSGEKREKYEKHEKSQTQIDNWMSWEEVLAIRKEFDDEVAKFSKRASINRIQYETLLEWLLLNLYTQIPPRRNQDYSECYILLK